jgi:phospholipase D1/2
VRFDAPAFLRLKETLRVFINMPLLPGFEGQLGTTGGGALLAVLRWTYESITQGSYCLFHHLKLKGGV